ncbi:hypothetical protein M595_1739 [Lyngbya aestuarii BL J]|uniref:Uncharacterized protein n=1 Tax=Lyngbya aestuarii BL J TaxID=1348334 RepID=U7QK13_9CYAN|nr:hypothetical protein [Lyngbya aestuarii]ERT08309.1 hypothetical protein M595_1739 [Lyngbya aestuarii BL J]
MQTKYESSSNPTEAQHSSHLSPVKSIGTSELPPAVKTSSLVALVAIIFATLVGSLLASPSPEEIASQSEEIESLTPTSTDTSSIVVVEDLETETPVTPTTETDSEIVIPTPDSETDSEIATPDSEMEISEPDITDPTAGSTTSTLTPETEIEIETTAPTTDATVSPPEASTSPSGLPAVTSSPSVEETQPPVETDPVATPPTQPDTLNPVAETPDSEIAASTPETATPEETMTAAAPEEVDTTQLSQSLYNQIDSTWTSPVDGESAYVVKLNSEGEIIGYEPKSQVAKNNVENTPLPELVKSDAASTDPAAQFEVVFSTSGILEVKPPQ